MTPRQLEVLLAVYSQGSQRKAAEKLGLAVPVLHRYLAQTEAKCRTKLLQASPVGTVLTEEGKEVAREYAALLERMKISESVVVGGTILTEELLLGVVSALDSEAKYDLVISDDERNLKDFKAGLMHVVLLDDPLGAYEMEDVRFEEVAEDRLLHVDHGPSYVRFKYGAQRIGFRHLDFEGVKYSVEGTTRSLTSLLKGNRSFFINESLALRKGAKITSATDPSLLEHKILALYREETPEVSWLLRELKRERL
ncbi:MAG TPA: LysR family transcriptional regulator [Methanomassiliicoccales archaeon]|nr:LysR family transcriptional regulator [Methanomassiliicoccales archaeon]